MSWLRSAVNKAVEVGNSNNLTRTVRNYADSVVQQAGHAIAEGAKRFQDQLISMISQGNRSFRSLKKSVQRLEEAAVSCRGPEMAEILRRWVILLKEVERLKLSQEEEKEKAVEQSSGGGASEDVSDIRRKISTYYDSDAGGEPMNFCDAFLLSQALEGITLSMILEAPNDEEVALLSDMFRLCLTGGKEVHNAIVSSIQDLATAFSSYNDEVLVKREELLQFAQSAITGLKINADLGSQLGGVLLLDCGWEKKQSKGGPYNSKNHECSLFLADTVLIKNDNPKVLADIYSQLGGVLLLELRAGKGKRKLVNCTWLGEEQVLCGFRKVDPNWWEFANEWFLRSRHIY